MPLDHQIAGSAPPSGPLPILTKGEAVYREIRLRILRGDLAPGLSVNQEAFAASLGVSITPLREALRRLEMEGLVKIGAHRTVTTAPLSSRELNELYVIRTELDSFAAGLAASAANDGELVIIGELARQKNVSDPVIQLERNRAFHRAIYSASHNGSLIGLLDQLWDRTDRYRLILVREDVIERPAPQQEHIDIADAIVARQAEVALRLTRDHIARSRIRIARALATIQTREDVPSPASRR